MKIVGILYICIFLMYGCKTEMDNYSGEDGIYFAVQTPSFNINIEPDRWAYTDTTVITFIKTSSMDSLIKLKVRTIGYVKDYNRHFEYKIIDTLTTAVEQLDYTYQKSLGVIPAGESETYIEFRIMRTDKLLNETHSITLDIMGGNDFSLPITHWYPLLIGDYTLMAQNLQRHTIIFNDAIPNLAPSGWWPGYFGTYSIAKIKLMMQVVNLTWDDFGATMTDSKAKVVGNAVDKHLKQMQAANTPIYDGIDKDGNPLLMTMGSYLY
ncbi:MAG: DUF4843 domain-containing protein [Marinifilaceae bacterium]